MDDIIPLFGILGVVIGLPWIILHYVTRWKTAATLTTSDENLMEDLYDLARRLEERVVTVERILTAENPNWRSIAGDPLADRIAAESSVSRLESRVSRTVSNEPGRIGQ